MHVSIHELHSDSMHRCDDLKYKIVDITLLLSELSKDDSWSVRHIFHGEPVVLAQDNSIAGSEPQLTFNEIDPRHTLRF